MSIVLRKMILKLFDLNGLDIQEIGYMSQDNFTLYKL